MRIWDWDGTERWGNSIGGNAMVRDGTPIIGMGVLGASSSSGAQSKIKSSFNCIIPYSKKKKMLI
jgi:hypothetical protein